MRVVSLQEKETALHCAAVRGNLDCVRILLEHGAPINNTDKVPALEDSGGEKMGQKKTQQMIAITQASCYMRCYGRV